MRQTSTNMISSMRELTWETLKKAKVTCLEAENRAKELPLTLKGKKIELVNGDLFIKWDRKVRGYKYIKKCFMLNMVIRYHFPNNSIDMDYNSSTNIPTFQNTWVGTFKVNMRQ